jgi:hypothetical protein
MVDLTVNFSDLTVVASGPNRTPVTLAWRRAGVEITDRGTNELNAKLFDLPSDGLKTTHRALIGR